MAPEMGEGMRQSQGSVQRIQKELQQIEESDAVKEYKFITQQIDEIARGKSPTMPLSEDVPQMQQENNYMRLKIDKLNQQLQMTKHQLELERRSNREHRSQTSNGIASKNELEQFFMECINEVKKDVQRR